jgi:hypothetical protein
MSRSRLALVLLGLASSGLAVFVLVRSIDLPRAFDAMGRASPGMLALSTLVALLGYFFRAVRWGEVLSPRVKLPVARLFSATMIGFLAINVLPARLGELVRAYTLARTDRLPTATVLGSVAVERILDLGALGVFWALSLLFAPFPAWFRVSGYATIGIGLAGTAALWIVYRSREKLLRPGGRVRAWLPREVREGLESALPAFGAGLQILREPALLARAAAWSLVVWGVGGSVFLFVGESLGMRLPFWSMFYMSFVIAVGILIPSSPGFIGVLEGACVVGLALLGIGGAEALAFGILYHVVQVAPLLLLGTLFAVREHVLPGLAGRDGGETQGFGRKD